MEKQTVKTRHGDALGYVVSMENVNIVFIKTRSSILACGAFNISALNNFDCPAARVAGKDAMPIVTIQDLLQGSVVEVNASAQARHVNEGMSGGEALDALLAAEKTD